MAIIRVKPCSFPVMDRGSVANHHKRPKPPDGHSIDLKVWRAEAHQKALHDEFALIDKIGLVRFETKIEREGLDHSFHPMATPGIPDSFLAKLGDCLHNLRSALDHLAYNLVRVSGPNPDNQVTFPVCPNEFRIDKCTGAEEPALKIAVRPDIREWIDSVQPYKGTDTGRRLLTLHDLDVIDKHRSQLVAVFAATGTRKTLTHDNVSDALRFPLGRVTWLSREPLEHGKKCLTVTYEAPQLEVDPYLKIPEKILFARRSPAQGEPVISVVDDLMRLVRDKLIPASLPFFGIDSAAAHFRTIVVWK